MDSRSLVTTRPNEHAGYLTLLLPIFRGGSRRARFSQGPWGTKEWPLPFRGARGRCGNREQARRRERRGAVVPRKAVHLATEGPTSPRSRARSRDWSLVSRSRSRERPERWQQNAESHVHSVGGGQRRGAPPHERIGLRARSNRILLGSAERPLRNALSRVHDSLGLHGPSPCGPNQTDPGILLELGGRQLPRRGLGSSETRRTSRTP